MAGLPNPFQLAAALSDLPSTLVRLTRLVEETMRGVQPLDEDLHDIHGVALELKPEIIKMRKLMEGFVEQAERLEVQLDALRSDLSAVPFVQKTPTGTEPSN